MGERPVYADKIESSLAEEMRSLEDTRELRIPISLDELRQATENAFLDAESMFSVFQDEQTPQSIAYEQWVRATDAIEKTFLECNEGALGKQLIKLAALDDEAFESHRNEALELVEHTASLASDMYASIHRLSLLGYGKRADVACKLENGDLSGSKKVHGVSITPSRKTVIGLLKEIDNRVGTKNWTLEFPPELPKTVSVADPFRFGDTSIKTYWRDKILARRSVEKKSGIDVYSVSRDTTRRLAYELEAIAHQTDDDQLAAAAKILAGWIEIKDFYYEDPDPRDFEQFHFGLEEPHRMMEVFQALDTIKQKDPEMFVEILGVNPEDGGRSPYFGSFLQKALSNTRRIVDEVTPELHDMAIVTMMNQLLAMDENVTPYAGVMSQEALEAMASAMATRVREEKTLENKASMLAMLLVPYVPLAVDAQVREQLERFREANIEEIRKELRRHLDDRDHPLKIAEYISSMSLTSFGDTVVAELLQDIYRKDGKELDLTNPEKTRARFRERTNDVMYPLYDRIPLLDETREDLGYGNIARIIARDALSLEPFAPSIRLGLNVTDPVDHPGLEFIRGYLHDHRPISKGVLDSLREQGGWTKRAYFNEAAKLATITFMDVTDVALEPDRPNFIAEFLLRSFRNGMNTVEEHFVHDLISEAKEPDRVLLALLSLPGGAKAAFNFFDHFCDAIEPRRMKEILHDELAFGVLHLAIDEFRAMFGIGEGWRAEETFKNPHTRDYLDYLRGKIVALQTDFQYGKLKSTEITVDEYVDLYRKMNKTIIEGKTPWTVGETRKHGDQEEFVPIIDMWEIWKYVNDGQERSWERTPESTHPSLLTSPDKLGPLTENEKMDMLHAIQMGYIHGKPHTNDGIGGLALFIKKFFKVTDTELEWTIPPSMTMFMNQGRFDIKPAVGSAVPSTSTEK
ncbi:hypothetical protein A2501_00945 [Candidatus Uhrbacteria bacterium RIFOXYC12_FULL_57_11]|nr:MAG: hypothetical protein A2501_00945 [Candidatus Uhrbacteria bacterium RIFOXYC12_FULL_57_11]